MDVRQTPDPESFSVPQQNLIGKSLRFTEPSSAVSKGKQGSEQARQNTGVNADGVAMPPLGHPNRHDAMIPRKLFHDGLN